MTNKIQMTPELTEKLEKEMQEACAEAIRLTDTYFNISLDFSEKSIGDIEAACDDVHYSMPGGKTDKNIHLLMWYWGAYIGEVFRRNCGGHWEYWEDEYGKATALVSPKNGAIFPRSKVDKRLKKGKEENLVEYYKTMKELYF